MNEKFLVLALGGLVAVGGVYILLHDPGSFGRWTESFTSRQQSPGPPKDVRPRQAPAVKPKRPVQLASANRVAPLVADIQNQAPAAAKPRVKRSYVPRLSEVPVDMSMSELVNRFGTPDVMASWSAAGKLNRKLIYESGATWLEIATQNDRVVSVSN